MTLTWSRVFSLVVLATAYLRAMHVALSLWYVTLVAAPLLILIWFPCEVDELTFGMWYEGYTVDTHTPPVLIAAFGWLFLLLFAALLFRDRKSVV